MTGQLLLELKVEQGTYNSHTAAYSDGLSYSMNGKTIEIPLKEIKALYKNEYQFWKYDDISIVIKYSGKKKLIIKDKEVPGIVEFFEEVLLKHWTNIYKENTETIKWINGCTAILHMQCDWDQNLFGGLEKTWMLKILKKGFLKRTWGVKNRKQLDDVINDLLKGNPVQAYYQAIENGSVSEVNENVYYACAWDLQRVIFLSGLGYYAGYMTKNEALDMSLKAAIEIQKIFTNWDHFNMSYLIGHMLWCGVGFEVVGQNPYTRKKIYDFEKDRIYNPWLIDWNTNLKKEW